MKTKAILIYALSLVMAIFTTSCGGDEEGGSVTLTGISIDSTAVTVEVEGATTLVATLEPTGATGDIVWSSQDPSVAIVNNGVVTGLKVGTTTVVAAAGAFSATCEVTVNAKYVEPGESLKGSEYFAIYLDETSLTTIQDKIVANYGPDDVDNFLYVWPDGTSLQATVPSGLNFYGNTDGWQSFKVGTIGWSGAGYLVGKEVDMTRMNASPEDYYFHIAVKSSQEGSAFTFTFENQTSTPFTLVLGSETTAYADFPRDGEWHEFDIPYTYFEDNGFFYNEKFSGKNIFTFSAGGVSGTTIDFDAVFFYKKAE